MAEILESIHVYRIQGAGRHIDLTIRNLRQMTLCKIIATNHGSHDGEKINACKSSTRSSSTLFAHTHFSNI